MTTRMTGVVLAVGMVFAGVAQGAVIAEWDAGTPVSDGAFSGTKYLLTVTSDEGPISALDIGIKAKTSFYNEQYREGRIFTAGPTASYDVDTLFLFNAVDLVISTQGEEDVTPPDVDQIMTSNLYGAYSFKEAGDYFDSATVAQVVVPEGDPAPTLEDFYNTNDSLNVFYAVVNGAKIAVPEPTTLALLVLGGLAAVCRRRTN